MAINHDRAALGLLLIASNNFSSELQHGYRQRHGHSMLLSQGAMDTFRLGVQVVRSISPRYESMSISESEGILWTGNVSDDHEAVGQGLSDSVTKWLDATVNKQMW